MGREQRNRFGEVDRRAAADGDEAVAIVRPIKIPRAASTASSVGFVGTPSNTGAVAEDGRAGSEPLDQSGGDHPRIRDDQGTADRQARKVGCQIQGGSDLEADIGRDM